MLEDIIKNIPKPNWLLCKDWLAKKAANHELTQREREQISSQLERAFMAGSSKSATNWLVLSRDPAYQFSEWSYRDSNLNFSCCDRDDFPIAPSTTTQPSSTKSRSQSALKAAA